MKLFLDTADTELIEKHFQTDLIDGITTNPTLIMKSGRDPEEVYQQLIDMGIDDISMEVVGDFDEMYMEGLRLSRKFGKNATIKGGKKEGDAGENWLKAWKVENLFSNYSIRVCGEVQLCNLPSHQEGITRCPKKTLLKDMSDYLAINFYLDTPEVN